jgi:minor histocompatibility antigen H13
MMVVSVLLSGYYVATKNWIASNIFGICFALNAIQLLALDSFKTGMILLSGLFLYDIFWVFGTEVMVSVAKNFDAPVKVIFPRLFFGLPAGQAYQFAMLGLGDIVIPGVFVALCLRFDQHLAGTKNPNLGRSTRFCKPYFTACFIAYALGLGTTIYVMHTFKAAQPALLYLSPACILSVLFMGLVRGEIKEVFKYTSEEGIEAAKAKEAEEKKKQEEKAGEKKGSADKVPALVKTDSAAVVSNSEKTSSTSDSEQEKSTPKIRKRKGGKAQKNKK